MDITRLVEYCKAYQKAEVADRLKIAEDVCEKRFVFTLRWDMEQTVEPVQFQGEILWEHQPKDDLEWTVMLCRQRYLLCLAQAYALTGAPKYRDCYMATVESFIDSTPLAGSAGKNTWRTIDTGIRANNWVQSLRILESCGALPQPFLDKVYESLGVHIRYLLDCYDITHYMSNWGVLVNSGLLAAILYLRGKGLPDFLPQVATLCQRLEEQIEVQVLADGVQWEQSPMYHHEVLWCYLEVIELLQREKLPVSPIVLAKARDMCYATLYSAKPNHHQLIRSDSDDTDVRDILTLGAYLFRDGQLKFGGYPLLDFDNLWRLDAPAWELYRTLAARQPDYTSKALCSSGNYYLRTGWGEDATLLAFRCGPIGNSHGHVDLLHLDLFAGGEDILTDSGRLTYLNNEKRLYLKSQLAHNSLTVDGKPFTDCVASWQYGRVAHPLQGQVCEDAQYYYVSGGHLGYLTEGVFVRRQVVCIKPDIVILLDSFYTGGAHSYTQKFHFGGGSLTLNQNRASWQSEKNRAVLVALGEQPRMKQEQTLLSRWYNQESSAPCVEITYGFPATAGVMTVIGVNPQPDFTAKALPVLQSREQRLLTADTAQALRIVNGGKSYTLIFSINDPVGGINLLTAGGCTGYGEVLLFDTEKKRTVLAN